MAIDNTPDIRVLVGVDGASIDGKSGALILKELNKVASQIGSKNAPQVAFTVDVGKTTKNIQDQLNTIVKSINVSPINLNIQTNQSSIGNFAEDEYRKLIEGTNGKKAKANLVAYIQEKQGLAEVIVQKEKDADVTKKQEKATKSFLAEVNQLRNAEKSLNISENFANKLGKQDLSNDILQTRANVGLLNKEVDELYNKSDNGNNIVDHLSSDAIINLTERLKDANKAVSDLHNAATKESPIFIKDERIAKQSRDISEFALSLGKFEKANDKFKGNSGAAAEFERIKIALADIERRSNLGETVGVDLERLKAQTNNWKSSLEAAGLLGQTWFGKLQAQMQKLGVYFGASAVMMGSWQQIKQTISTVIELDKVTTDLSIATGMNRKETQALLDTYSELGKELGATTSAVAGAADDWLRQGKSIATTNKLVKDSLMLSKLGKIDTPEATTALTTMSKAYKIADDDMTSLVDKLTAVDAVSATTAGGIAKSFQETAVSAKLAGISIDRMAGYIATVSEISGDAPESVGNFFKSFLSRMSNIKEGRMIDPDTGEDLSTVESVLKNIGIQLRNDQGQFRNFQDVLDEIAVKWKELEATGDKVGQTKIASALGLTRQQEKAKILFEHYDEAIKYAEVSANSLGTAEEKFNNAYLTSTQASMDAFTAQYEQMSNAIWNGGLIKGTFDTGTGFLGAVTWLIENLGIIPTLATVAAGSLSALSNKGWLKNLSDKRTYALLRSGGNTERADMFSKRLYSKSLKWCA